MSLCPLCQANHDSMTPHVTRTFTPDEVGERISEMGMARDGITHDGYPVRS